MKKLKGFIMYHSCIIMPLTTFIICYLINKKWGCFDIGEQKSTSLTSIASSFIGVLITILTIYLAVPKNEFARKRLRESKHERIYLFNILGGITVLLASIMYWIFFNNSAIPTMLFLAGITNIAITLYYTFALIKLL